MEFDSDTVAMFVSITGATADVAQHLLSAAAGDVNAAVSMYFETGLDASSASDTRSALNATSVLARRPSNPTGDDDDAIAAARAMGVVDDEDVAVARAFEGVDAAQQEREMARILENARNRASAPSAAAASSSRSGAGARRNPMSAFSNFEDEELDVDDDDEDYNARRRNEPLSSSRPSHAAAAGGSGGVRPPVAPRRETLVEADDDPHYHGIHATGHAYRPYNRAHMGTALTHGVAPGGAAVGGMEPFRNFAGEAGQPMSAFDAAFQPPFDIMYRGTFENAMHEAVSKGRWLLVNLQAPDEFVCQIMNRDVWSAEQVKAFVRESFVFMQLMSYSPEGQRYTNFYPVGEYPHVAVVDPRTGERVQILRGVTTPESFVDAAVNFLDSNSILDEGPRRDSNVGEKKSKRKTSVSDMTEEEMLEAALAASLADNLDAASGKKARSSKTEADDDDDDDMLITGDDEDVVELKDPDRIAGKKKEEPLVLREEPPASDPLATRIQIRLPDGSRVVRRFLKTDTVQRIMDFVRLTVEGAHESSTLELHALREALTTKMNKTVAEVGLENAVVTVSM